MLTVEIVNDGASPSSSQRWELAVLSQTDVVSRCCRKTVPVMEDWSMLSAKKNFAIHLIESYTVQIVMIDACLQFAQTLFKINFDEKDRESGFMKCVWQTIRLEEVQNINFMQAMSNSRKVAQRSRIELNQGDGVTFLAS
jgi:hypothetical protein